MIDLATIAAQAALIGGSFKGFEWLGNVIKRKNGNGSFSRDDYATLREVAKGVDLLHEDITALRHDIRDCLGRR